MRRAKESINLDTRILSLSGPVTPTDIDDLWSRMTLRLPEIGLGSDSLDVRGRFVSYFGEDRLPAMLAKAPSDAAERCIARFATIEADTTNAGLKGIGRMTAQAFPRLGGVLQSAAPAGAQNALRVAVGRTMHAGYLAALSVEFVLSQEVAITNADTLWDAWVPHAFEATSETNDYVTGIAKDWPFWAVVLNGLGMPKEAKALQRNRVTQISSAICGLASAGTMLALVERQGNPPHSGSNR